MTTFQTLRGAGAMGVLAGALLMQSACGSEIDTNDVARGRGTALDRTTHALLSGDLLSVNGTYGTMCRNRAGAWSLEIASGAILDNPPLTVILNDTNCALTVTALRTSSGVIAAAPTFVLTGSYQSTPSAFGTGFYANARLSSVTFAGDFVVTVLYSDDPALASAARTAAFEVVESAAVGQSVPAPNYAIDLTEIALLTDVNDVVVSATGSAVLIAGSVTGQRYVLLNTSGLVTYEAIDAAYIAATDSAFTATIPVADFSLVDLTTPNVRTLIIANVSDGVTSYQRFEIMFNPAP